MTQVCERVGDLLRREDILDTARGNGVLWHLWEAGGVRILSEGDTTLGLDRLQTQSAIRGGAREQYPDRQLLPFARKGGEEAVNRETLSAGLGQRLEHEGVLLECEVGSGRRNIDVVWFHGHASGDFAHWHLRRASEQVRQQTLIRCIQLLDDKR